jgi:hypothetical protein
VIFNTRVKQKKFVLKHRLTHLCTLSLLLIAIPIFSVESHQGNISVPSPGRRVLLDAHNCYPYDGQWNDRLDRALSTGTPLAIEQDLAWYVDPENHQSKIVVTHETKLTGHEPTLREYFFERVRPIMEKALREGNRGDWPLITLNLDFKTEQPELLSAVWQLLGEFEPWLTTAERTNEISRVMPLHAGPMFVLTGDSDAQARVFYEEVPLGNNLRLFGAVHVHAKNPMSDPQELVPLPANNYRRWWNNPWSVVEAGGQKSAGDWSDKDTKRLASLVAYAHKNGLWIRFYTLDGGTEEAFLNNGWFSGYNFGSVSAARIRWQAAQEAGVDYIATDQYEELSRLLHSSVHD